MHIYDESTSRRTVWSVQINWSRPLTFSDRQAKFISNSVPHARGVYCIYAKNRTFSYLHPSWTRQRWSSIVYIGSGWIDDRLCAHLLRKKNDLLQQYLETEHLAYRYDRIVDDDLNLDWPKTVEASLLHLFGEQFGRLPLANRRREGIPELPLDRFDLNQTQNFNFLRG